MRIVVYCPNLIGDAVMATPTLRALRAGFPNAQLLAVAKPAVAATLAGNPWFSETLLYQKKSKDPQLNMLGVVRRLRKTPCDLAVLLPNSWRSALMAWLAATKRRVGYARGGRGPLLTDRLKPPRDERGRYLPTPIITYYAQLAYHLHCSIDSWNMQLFVTEAEAAEARSAWSNLGLNDGRPVVCLNTGGAFGPAKNWPESHFATLANRLANAFDVHVLVLCGPAERSAARAIANQAKHPQVVSLADEPVSIGLTKASLQRSSLLITTDSGPRHIAGAFGVPVITLFGPTHIAWTRTYLNQSIHLQKPVPCGPCQRPVCPQGHHRCMTELHPESVFEAASSFLAPKPARPTQVPSGQSPAPQSRRDVLPIL